jgi:hypothetical protein
LSYLPRFAKCLLLSCVLLTGAALSACAGAPIQQMYDARQAVRAAEKAGAAQHAPELLAEAQAHLKTATASMHTQDYRVARDEAEVAREKAMAARRQAESAAPPPARQP